MKGILDLLLHPMTLMTAGMVGLVGVLALVVKVPFFAGIWSKLTGVVDSIARELDPHWHEALLLGVLFLVDRHIFAVVAGVYLIARVVVDAVTAMRKA